MAADRAVQPGLARSRTQRVLQLALWLAGAAILLILFEAASVHTITISPDGSTVLLEGNSIATGNLALHGWALSLDSFWTIDAPFYAIAIHLFGLRPLLLNLVPAVIAVLVVIVAITVASSDRRGAGRLAGAAVVIALLAFPAPDLADYLLQGPWHIGTALWCLLAFLGIAKHRFGFPWFVAVAFFTAGLLGDLMMFAFGVIPAIAAGLLAMRRRRRWRAGLPAISAGFASIALAFGIRWIAQVIGTFTLVNRNLPIRLPRVEANFGHLANHFAGLFGVGNLPIKGISNGASVFQVIHLIPLVGAIVSVLVTAAGMIIALFTKRHDARHGDASWCLDDLLVFGLLADLLMFIWVAPSGNLAYAKYLTPGVIFSIILTARVAAKGVEQLRAHRGRVGLIALGCAFIALFAAEFSTELSHPVPARPTQALTAFLENHDLHNGVGDYWSAQVTTVTSGGLVRVRPIVLGTDSRLARFDRQTSADWYRAQQFRFLVYDTARPWRGVNATSAIKAFGPAAHFYRVGTYRVLVWSHPVQVSASAASYGSPVQIFFSLAPVVP